MRSITELIVRTADLAEAEGRVLRAMTIRVMIGIGLILVAAGTLLGGVSLLFAGIYLYAADRLGPAAGAAITGALALGLGGGLMWLSRRMAA